MIKQIILNANSNNIPQIKDKTVDLIITSPPYPMIDMWDEMFSKQDSHIKNELENGNGEKAFELMHQILDKTWSECDRVLKDNGFVCINIGDATRTINDVFQLYSNHTRIINFFLNKGYCVLPDIHWRKQTNSPNKYMGSGMYPAGAYVTYEHEYILIFRKGGKRLFTNTTKIKRQESAYFWEERNVWFSDLWEIKGTSQVIKNINCSRERNASFPFEIPYRLVNMYSVKGDTVLDPFSGLATTNLACMASERNGIGVEIDKDLAEASMEYLTTMQDKINEVVDDRLKKHIDFISELDDEKKSKCYENGNMNFLVKTKQETDLIINKIKNINYCNGKELICEYV